MDCDKDDASSGEVYVFFEMGFLYGSPQQFGASQLELRGMIWSSNEDGSNPWSKEEITRYFDSFGLSLDYVRLEAEYGLVSWSQDHFDALEDVYKCCGLNPYTSQVADYLGLPGLDVLSCR